MRRRRHAPIEFKFSRRFGWGYHLVQVMVRKSAYDAYERRLPVNTWRPLTAEVRGEMFASRHAGALTPVVRGPFARDMRVMARAFWAPVAEEVIEEVRPFREYVDGTFFRPEIFRVIIESVDRSLPTP